jgi:hypothetical protein
VNDGPKSIDSNVWIFDPVKYEFGNAGVENGDSATTVIIVAFTCAMFGLSPSFSGGKTTYNEPSVAGIRRGSRFPELLSAPKAVIIDLPLLNVQVLLPQGSKPAITPSSVTTTKSDDKVSVPPCPMEGVLGEPRQKTASSRRQ